MSDQAASPWIRNGRPSASSRRRRSAEIRQRKSTPAVGGSGRTRLSATFSRGSVRMLGMQEPRCWSSCGTPRPSATRDLPAASNSRDALAATKRRCTRSPSRDAARRAPHAARGRARPAPIGRPTVRVGADRLDQLDDGRRRHLVAGPVELDVLRPDAKRHLAIGARRIRPQVGRSTATAPANRRLPASLDGARRTGSSAGCRRRSPRRCWRAAVDLAGVPTCWTTPSRMSTMRSAMVMAST